MHSVELDGPAGVLAATRHGPAPYPGLVLIHGGGQSHHSWRKIAAILSDQGQGSLAYDLRGHGQSAFAQDGNYRYPALIRDLDVVIEAAGAPAVLVGFSLGGKIALAAAGSLTPGRVAGIVLIDSVPRQRLAGVGQVASAIRTPEGGFASPEEAADQLSRAQDRKSGTIDAARLKRSMRQQPDGRWKWHWDERFYSPEQCLGVEVAMDYLEGAARQVSCPALLVRGGHSPIVDAQAADDLQRLIPHMEMVEIASAGHQVVADAPEELASIVSAFLEGLRRASPSER